jgi:hypothetical protein
VKRSAQGGLAFGIYPGSAMGDVGEAGPPDRPGRINEALGQLQGQPGRPFIVRAYHVYADPGGTVHAGLPQAPAEYDRYLGQGRVLDLVVQYHSRSGDIDGYCAFIEKLIDRHGEHLATLQIGEEANITGNPILDGAYPRVAEALIAGIRTAKDKARRSGYPGLSIGCNSSPLFGPGATFFTDLTRAGGSSSPTSTTSGSTSSPTCSARSRPPAWTGPSRHSSKHIDATGWLRQASATCP